MMIFFSIQIRKKSMFARFSRLFAALQTARAIKPWKHGRRSLPEMASNFDSDATLKSVLDYCRIQTAIIDKAGIRQ
jgi:hypothetical protein